MILLVSISWGATRQLPTPIEQQRQIQAKVGRSLAVLSKEGIPADQAKKYINPVTGSPFVAVRNGELVDGIIFIEEFRQMYPGEKAELMAILREGTLGNRQIVKFTWKGKSWVYSYRIGIKKASEIPDDFEKYCQQARAKDLVRFLKRHNITIHDLKDKKWDAVIGRDELFSSVFPKFLPGENKMNPYEEAGVQARRIFTRLRALGVKVTEPKAWKQAPDEYKHIKSVLHIIWEGNVYVWQPLRSPRWLSVALPENVLDRTIESIVFVEDFRKKNPREKAIVYVRPTSSPHADGNNFSQPLAAYTKKGQVYTYFPGRGEILMPVSDDVFVRPQDYFLEVRKALKSYPAKSNAGREPDEKDREIVRRTEVDNTRQLLEGVGIKTSSSPDGRTLYFSYEGNSFSYTKNLGTRIIEMKSPAN